MTAAAAPAPTPTPLRAEGARFWENLIRESRRQTEAINRLLSDNGKHRDYFVECVEGQNLQLVRSRYPTTTAQVNIAFEQWGPVLNLSVTGHQTPHLAFHQQEFELPIAADGDGSIVAIYDEGRGFSPREMACFVLQFFRRCFPGMSLPCPEFASHPAEVAS